jgi:hypothetical protein
MMFIFFSEKNIFNVYQTDCCRENCEVAAVIEGTNKDSRSLEKGEVMFIFEDNIFLK